MVKCGSMEKEFCVVALVGKYQSAEIAEALAQTARFLLERGQEVWLEHDTAQAVGHDGSVRVADIQEIGEGADLVVVLGGDGTMLATARRLAGCYLPMVGVNQGRLGFLTDVPRDRMFECLGDILDGHYLRERRVLLQADVWRDGVSVFSTTALNDVVLSRGEFGRMIEFELHVDGEYVYTQRSDGMIVSTPTGSTAYALSANGPILHPRLAGFVAVPLCPHALTYRPLALAHESTVEMVILPPFDARLFCDGQTLFEVQGGDRIHVKRAPLGITLLHPRDYSYFAVLREKLHWSAAPRLS